MAKKIKISQIKKMASWELEELDASSLGPKQAEAYDARLDILYLCNFLYAYGKYVKGLKVIPEGEDVAESHARDVADLSRFNKDALKDVFTVDNGRGMVELSVEDTTPLRYRFNSEGRLIKGQCNTKTFLGKRKDWSGCWCPVFLRVPNVWESVQESVGEKVLLTYASAVYLCKGDLEKLHRNFKPLSKVLLEEALEKRRNSLAANFK